MEWEILIKIQFVTFVLSEFDVTASTDCSSDYVTVTTGDPAQVWEAKFLKDSEKS